VRRLALLTIVLAPSLAAAFGAGISGYSGKPPAKSCTECHSGGTAPRALNWNTPATMIAGSTATVSVDIVSSATAPLSAGYDIASSDGTLDVISGATSSKAVNGEVTHTRAIGPAETLTAQARFTAPMTPGVVTLFVTALSSNGSGTGGDGVASSTRQITIEPPPDLLGLDLTGVDLAEPPPDLSGVDAVSGASSHADMAGTKPPPADEQRWACDCHVAGHAAPTSALLPLLVAVALLGTSLRRRRR
jgi:MYXO-CTERM domain-containing protein